MEGDVARCDFSLDIGDIGIGASIQSLNASALGVSSGLISVIILYCIFQ